MIAGNFIGENAVAAIGVSTSIVMFFTNVIIGFTTGVSIYIAQLTGRRDNEKIGEAIRTSFFYLVPAALLMALLSLGIIEQVLTCLLYTSLLSPLQLLQLSLHLPASR